MIRHYKALGMWLGAILTVAILALLLRPKLFPKHQFDYQAEVEHYSAEYHLDPALTLSVIKTESNFDPKARSHKDAYGLMQITAPTLEWAILREGSNAKYTAEDLYNPEINIKYGCLILSLLLQEFQDTDTALAAYNAGRSNALKWLKDSRYSDDGIHLKTTPYKETNDYIKKVNKHYLNYREKLGENQ